MNASYKRKDCMTQILMSLIFYYPRKYFSPVLIACGTKQSTNFTPPISADNWIIIPSDNSKLINKDKKTKCGQESCANYENFPFKHF